MSTLIISVPAISKSATDFINEVRGVERLKRDEIAGQYLLAGHVPDHMRNYVDIVQVFQSQDGETHSLILSVLPDFLCIGTNEDYIRIPLTPLTAQIICDEWGCMLPTTKMSDIIWGAAVNKMQPLPWGPPYDASMMSLDRVITHNKRINDLANKLGQDMMQLSAGHKKDVVMTKKLASQPKQVAIFGWHQLNGKNIQPLYLGHENTYFDYSHAERMVCMEAIIDDSPVNLKYVLSDSNICNAITNEGANDVISQPFILFQKIV